MSELRDRIANALGDCWNQYGVDDYNLMADAVISELDLIRADLAVPEFYDTDEINDSWIPPGPIRHTRYVPSHRYVTPWKANE